jgi:hypothetical protein
MFTLEESEGKLIADGFNTYGFNGYTTDFKSPLIALFLNSDNVLPIFLISLFLPHFIDLKLYIIKNGVRQGMVVHACNLRCSGVNWENHCLRPA